MKSACLFFCSGALVLASVNAQEWTRFRGPNGSGVSNASGIPAEWKKENIQWTQALPGSGHASPVFWGKTVFLPNSDTTKGLATFQALDSETGKEIWSHTIPFKPFAKHNFNSFASSTPLVDEERVYFYWSTMESGELLAFSHQGQLQWKANVGSFNSEHGSGLSPILVGDRIIMNMDRDEGAFLMALNAKNGKPLWSTPRTDTKASFSTPALYTPKNSTEPLLIFLSMSHGITAIRPSDGQVAWELPGVFDKRTVSSPVIAGDLIIGTCGSGGGGNYLVAVRPPTASHPKPQVAYKITRAAPYVPTSIYYNQRLFTWSDGGIVSCLNAEDGEVIWQERVGGRYFGSPVCIDGKIFCVSDQGEVVVVEASDTFKVLARNPLGELCHSTPAVANNHLYIRTETKLHRIGEP